MENKNRIVKYAFSLKSILPSRFGSIEANEIVKDSEGNPVIFGNSIFGSIRNHIKESFDEDLILDVFGGEEEGTLDFRRSRAYVSDGLINEWDIEKKKGTRIDYEFCSASNNAKYEFEYLKEGFKLEFEIEIDMDEKYEGRVSEDSIDNIMLSIIRGFESGNILLGGQKNNNFGRFKVEKVQKKICELYSIDSINSYIEGENDVFLDVEELKIEQSDAASKDTIHISLDGEFPYGVYQNYERESQEYGEVKKPLEITGIKNDMLKSSSLKGLLRNETHKMLKSVNEDKSQELLEEIFGSTGKMGMVRCDDVKLEKDNQHEVIIYNPNKSEEENKKEDKEHEKEKKRKGYSTYIKIDRVSGGNMSGSLKVQDEVCGSAKIDVYVKKNIEDSKACLFPILYSLVNIGKGDVPIGGRTSIGLGQYIAKTLKVAGYEYDFSNQELEKNKKFKEFVKECLNEFEGWCKND